MIKLKPMLGDMPVSLQSTEEIVKQYEHYIIELSSKEVELIQVKEEYNEKEFQIKYVDDINFKELYGRANDDTRNYHVTITLKELLDKKQDLEISIDYLKRRISFLKTVLYLRMEE